MGNNLRLHWEVSKLFELTRALARMTKEQKREILKSIPKPTVLGLAQKRNDKMGSKEDSFLLKSRPEVSLLI